MPSFQLTKDQRRNLLRITVLVCGIAFFYVSAFARRSHYKHLKHANSDVNCIKHFAPRFTTTLYSATVDVTRHHFSGILFFKVMPDSSTRVVFTNEMGVKFFDFAFTKYSR